DAQGVIDKFREEISELSVEVEGGDPKRLEHEIGDILFTAVNMARKLGVEPELALEHANQRFIARFQHMEQAAAGSQRKLEDLSPAELDKFWGAAKASLP
ncbi:MAG: MazG nucleotide pyrophosphohydrolase domain-containing protein, partial [Chthoniobacterales bacterium]